MAGRQCSARFENEARRAGALCIAGVDEVGRGALFGPVVAVAVVLDPGRPIRGLDDSKKISAPERERLDRQIRARARAYALASVDAAQIDCLNIYQASRRAMREALAALAEPADFILVDGLPLDWPVAQRALVHGDARSVSIAAASIVAKVYRDALMRLWDAIFPAYGFASNKGYGTPEHLAALERWGPTPLHRRSFEPLNHGGTEGAITADDEDQMRRVTAAHSEDVSTAHGSAGETVPPGAVAG